MKGVFHEDLLKMDIREVVRNNGISGYFTYKRMLNPEIVNKDYLEIRDELLNDLTFEMLCEVQKKES